MDQKVIHTWKPHNPPRGAHGTEFVAIWVFLIVDHILEHFVSIGRRLYEDNLTLPAALAYFPSYESPAYFHNQVQVCPKQYIHKVLEFYSLTLACNSLLLPLMLAAPSYLRPRMYSRGRFKRCRVSLSRSNKVFESVVLVCKNPKKNSSGCNCALTKRMQMEVARAAEYPASIHDDRIARTAILLGDSCDRFFSFTISFCISGFINLILDSEREKYFLASSLKREIN